MAYQVVGDGLLDLVLVGEWWNQVDAAWQTPWLAEPLRRLASFSRLILFDKRGVGLSDPIPSRVLPSLEQWMDDVHAVMDAAGSERAALFGSSGGGMVSALFAAAHPERTAALVIANSTARALVADDYLAGYDPEEIEAILRRYEDDWIAAHIELVAPALVNDVAFLQWYTAYLRSSASPSVAASIQRMLFMVDIRDVLSAIQAPTLVVHREGNRIYPLQHGRYLAANIPGARLAIMPGEEHLWWLGNYEAVVAETQEFLTGTRPIPEPDRLLATILFTDIVGSTEHLSRLGDARWHALLDQHDALVRVELRRYGGNEIDKAGDGFLATFDGPNRAIRCACAITEGAVRLGLEVRAGLHTGEIVVNDLEISGMAVHIGARGRACDRWIRTRDEHRPGSCRGLGDCVHTEGDAPTEGNPGRMEALRGCPKVSRRNHVRSRSSCASSFGCSIIMSWPVSIPTTRQPARSALVAIGANVLPPG